MNPDLADREPLRKHVDAIRSFGLKVRAPLCAQCRTPMRLERIDPNPSAPPAVVQSFKCESCGLFDRLTHKGERLSRKGRRLPRDLAKRARSC